MKNKASIYVPAIGKVTIVVLLRNLLVCRPKRLEMATKLLTKAQRIVQNRIGARVEPAGPVEKHGTIEQSAPSG